MIKDGFTIRKLHNTEFSKLYNDFILCHEMNSHKYVQILSLATLFINCENENIRRLGYRIIVIYGNQTLDYKPLYEIAVNLGLIPISHFIETMYAENNIESFFTEINACLIFSFDATLPDISNAFNIGTPDRKRVDIVRQERDKEALYIIEPNTGNFSKNESKKSLNAAYFFK